MKILVLGAGAVGGYFGGRMHAAGLDVGFVVRGPRAAQLREHGLTIISPEGEERISNLKIHVAGASLPPADILLLTIKATGLDAAISSLKDNIGEKTLIVPLLNGLRHIEALSDAFGEEAVAGGACYIQASTDEAGVIHRHSQIRRLVIGARREGQSVVLKRFIKLVAPAGFEADYAPNIDQAMWNKVALLATLAGATCLMRGAVGEIVAAPFGEEVTRAMLGECLKVAEAEGYALSADDAASAEKHLLTKGSGLSSSMLGDIRSGKLTEGDHIIGDLIARAKKHGVPAPYLKAAHTAVLVHEGRVGT